jgi:glucokinase
MTLRAEDAGFPLPAWAIGVDVGGTKCAAGLIHWPDGRALFQATQPTDPGRGGEAVLADVIQMIRSIQHEAAGKNLPVAVIGIGVAELVSVHGSVVSAATIPWCGLPLSDRIRTATSLSVRIDADVRAAARAEALLGAGRGLGDFLYVTIGTGISAALVIDGQPYAGARGLTGTFASSPQTMAASDSAIAVAPSLERFASGPALAARMAAHPPDFSGSAKDVLELAAKGNKTARTIVETAGQALGSAIAGLVNMLDPAAVVLGGGLGLARGLYRDSLEAALRRLIWSDAHRDLPVHSAALGSDAGWIGAALCALTAHAGGSPE